MKRRIWAGVIFALTNTAASADWKSDVDKEDPFDKSRTVVNIMKLDDRILFMRCLNRHTSMLLIIPSGGESLGNEVTVRLASPESVSQPRFDGRVIGIRGEQIGVEFAVDELPLAFLQDIKSLYLRINNKINTRTFEFPDNEGVNASVERVQKACNRPYLSD